MMHLPTFDVAGPFIILAVQSTTLYTLEPHTVFLFFPSTRET